MGFASPAGGRARLSGLAQLASNVALPRVMTMGIGSPSIASMYSSGGMKSVPSLIGGGSSAFQRHVPAAVAPQSPKGRIPRR